MPMEWLQEHYRNSRDAIYPQRVLERYRMGMKSGGSIGAVRILVGEDSCQSCKSLAGIVYSLENAPELPNPSCTNAGNCRCTYRPIMTYDPSLKDLSAESFTGVDVSQGQ